MVEIPYRHVEEALQSLFSEYIDIISIDVFVPIHPLRKLHGYVDAVIALAFMYHHALIAEPAGVLHGDPSGVLQII